jgi:predicted  nucleic acid-binding Zn-ribbon protein
MKVKLYSFFRLLILFSLILASAPWAAADVSKEIVTEYENTFVNRAMFLKVPIRGERQTIFIRGNNIIPDDSTSGLALSFLVGEQVRVTELRFRNSSIEFRVSSIDGIKRGTLVFQFPGQLEFNFPERGAFDKALNNSLTSGLSYREIETAKKEYLQDEFRRVTQQMALTTSTSSSFVTEAISTEIPEVAASIKGRETAEKALAALRSEYDSVDAERKQLNEKVRELTSALSREQEASRSIRNERDLLSRKEETQQQELAKLRDDNSKMREQLSSLAKEMDLQLGSNSSLSGQVDSLSSSLQGLKKDWAALQQKMESTENELNKIRDERNKLTSELSLSKRKAAQLESSLNSLTSNRNSLEANFVRTKNRLENLELAARTAESLSLSRMPGDSGENKGAISYAINLLSKRIGVISIKPPENITDTGRADFTVESPDTVQFTEEERVMFASLGKETRVRALWVPMGGSLQSSLTGGEEIQAVAPREKAEWTWTFSGAEDALEPVLLKISFLDENENVIPVTDLEFEIGPKSIIPLKLSGSIWLPLLIGFVIGSLLVAILFRFTGKGGNGKSKREKSSRDPSKYSTQKDL